MNRPRIALFSMSDPSHFSRLCPLLQGLVSRGVDAYVFTDRRFESLVEAAGGHFVDLFSNFPVDEADSKSQPRSSRYVTYAAHYADAVCEELQQLDPGVIIYDTFAVIGKVVALRLGLPHVNLCAGHNVSPRPDFYKTIERDLVVDPSEECLRAVEELKQRDGLRQMSPLGYISTLSPDLNVYCEPQEFLSPAEREQFAPIAFFGSLDSELLARVTSDRPPRSRFTSPTAHIYISFGTIIWRHFEALALRTMARIVEAVGEMESTTALLSLGGADISPEARKTLERDNVRVEHYVDQAAALRESDLFITHHGLNSTHEAVLYQVPMLSYPFLWDQPGLARRCQELGIAVALADTLRGEPGSDEIRSTIERTFAAREAMHARLEAALSWEHRVEAERGAVLDRIVALGRR